MNISIAVLFNKLQRFLFIDLYYFQLLLWLQISNDDKLSLGKFYCHYKFLRIDESNFDNLELFSNIIGNSFQLINLYCLLFFSGAIYVINDDWIACYTLNHFLCLSPLLFKRVELIVWLFLLKALQHFCILYLNTLELFSS